MLGLESVQSNNDKTVLILEIVSKIAHPLYPWYCFVHPEQLNSESQYGSCFEHHLRQQQYPK